MWYQYWLYVCSTASTCSDMVLSDRALNSAYRTDLRHMDGNCDYTLHVPAKPVVQRPQLDYHLPATWFLRHWNWWKSRAPNCNELSHYTWSSYCLLSFHFYGPLNKHLAGKRFVTNASVKQDVTSWPQTINSFLCRTQALVPRCYNPPSAVHVPRTYQSQNKFLSIRGSGVFIF
jgi:hypothetical protein